MSTAEELARIMFTHRRHPEMELSDEPRVRAMVRHFLSAFWDRTYDDLDDLREATLRAWQWLGSPTRLITPDLWREVFATTGPILTVPVETSVVYRIAPEPGWSWATDPWDLMEVPGSGLAPQFIFHETLRRFPDWKWWRATIRPEHVHIATRSRFEFRQMYLPGEVVVDPLNLRDVEHVSTEEMERLHFSDFVFDRATRRWSKSAEALVVSAG